MLNVGVCGIGNAGNQIALLANREGIDAVAINTSENDLSTIPNSIIKIAVGDLRGTGKNRDESKQFLKTSIKKILEDASFIKFMDDKDVVFVVSSTGGGTGSGMSPVMTEILSKSFPDTKIILVAVIPTQSEAYSTQINTISFLKELYEKVNKPTYMIYDNDNVKDVSSHVMMGSVNQSIVEDIKVIMGMYNHTTKFASIDEKDMTMLISSPGRIVVARYEDFKEKDIDETHTIDSKLENILKTSTHARLQRDKVVLRTGVITNVSERIAEMFDDRLTELQKYIGVPVEEFTHISINEDRNIPNSVYFIASGLSNITDRIAAINDRIEEIDSIQDKAPDNGDSDILNAIDLQSANSKKKYVKKNVETSVNISSIFDDFM